MISITALRMWWPCLADDHQLMLKASRATYNHLSMSLSPSVYCCPSPLCTNAMACFQVFPSVENMRNSLEGYMAGQSFPFTYQTYNSQTYIKQYMQYVNSFPGTTLSTVSFFTMRWFVASGEVAAGDVVRRRRTLRRIWEPPQTAERFPGFLWPGGTLIS